MVTWGAPGFGREGDADPNAMERRAAVRATLAGRQPSVDTSEPARGDSREYLQFVRRVLRGYSRRVIAGDEDDLADLVVLRDAVDGLIADTVRGLHYGPASLTWAQVGSALGITRQAAQQRYGRPTIVTRPPRGGASRSSS